MQLHLPATGDEIANPIGLAQPLAGSAHTERIGPDDDGDRLTMARDRDLFPSQHALKDLRERCSSLADRHRVRHSRKVHRCTVPRKERASGSTAAENLLSRMASTTSIHDVDNATADLHAWLLTLVRGSDLNFAVLSAAARRQASAFARTAEERDSIAQEALARAWERRGTFDPSRGPAESWLFGLVRNVAREHHRDRGRQESLLDRLWHVISDESSSDRVEVLDALLALRRDEQELLYLRFWEGRKHREIADHLGITEAACRQRLRRAIVQMGRALR